MATRVLADEDLEVLRGFPEIGREELARFFTLTPADVAFIDPGRGRGPADRMGLAVTLCSLSWLGFVPDDVAAAPQAAVARLAGQLQVDSDALRLYGRWAEDTDGAFVDRPVPGHRKRQLHGHHHARRSKPDLGKPHTGHR